MSRNYRAIRASFRNRCLVLIVCGGAICSSLEVRAETTRERSDTHQPASDSSRDRRSEPLVRQGIDDRPYLQRLQGGLLGTSSLQLAMGGYVDLVGSAGRAEGVSEGWSFEARRFNLFITSQIAQRIRLTSELEFEHGTEEIALETAAVDFLAHYALNFRGGILLVPLGRFNITHDSPIYDLIDRPLVSTLVIPSTLSEVGVGIFGAFFAGRDHKVIYELYAVNGLAGGVIAAEGTRLAAGKSRSRFATDNNGAPALTGRLAYSFAPPGGQRFDIGGSFYSGIYNDDKIDGIRIDSARWLTVAALDWEATWGRFMLRGEGAYAHIDIPDDLSDVHASDQFGLYLEGLVDIFRRPIWGFASAKIVAVARVDFVDLNLGNLEGSDHSRGDEQTRLTMGLSFRPVSTTSLRLAYLQQWNRDLLRNSARVSRVEVGLATYF